MKNLHHKIFSKQALSANRGASQKSCEAGFTLVELVIVISILGVTLSLSTDMILSLTRAYAKTQINTELEQNSNFVFQKLEKELRTSNGAVTINSTNNQITFTDVDGQQITYKIENGVAQRRIGALGAFEDLTNDDMINGVYVSCSQCFYLNPSVSANIIRLNITFSQPLGENKRPFTGSVTLDNTIVVRGLY